MKTILIKDILVSNPDGHSVEIYGWVRTKRDSKNLVFLQINDGSCFASIQATKTINDPEMNKQEKIKSHRYRLRILIY